MNELFGDIMEPDYGVNNAPEDSTEIKQVILYFSNDDVPELKRLAKEAMKRIWPSTYIEDGNLSNLYLYLLRKYDKEIQNK